MKKSFVFLSVLFILVFSSGCSATWDGVVDDTSKNLDSTRQAIHEATAAD